MQIKVIKKQKGVGDTVEMLLKATGIHYIANAMQNGDPTQPCKPCQQRKEELNKKFPYGSKQDI